MYVKSSPTVTLLPPSCCAKAGVKASASANAPSPTSPTGQKPRSTRSADSSRTNPCSAPTDAFDIIRSKPHGHVAAVLGTLRKLGLDRMLSARPCPERERVVALIAARVLGPVSKLATARALAEATARDSLAETLGLGETSEDQLYAAMDWLLERQVVVEKHLAQRHLGDGALVLYDLTSVYLEGRCCPLARHGHSRDGKRGKLQIEFGLLCDREGRPVAVEVFEGNTADPQDPGASGGQAAAAFRTLEGRAGGRPRHAHRSAYP